MIGFTTSLRGERSSLARLLVIWAGAMLLVQIAPSSATADAPRLRASLKAARLAVLAHVTDVKEYDNGRVAVAALRVDQVIKGSAAGTVSVIEMRDTPLPPAFVAGRDLVAFLVPATRNTYLAKHVPAGDYWSLVKARPAYLDGVSAADVRQTAHLVTRVLGRTQPSEASATPPATSERALAFDLIAARPPVLVEDGTTGLRAIDGLAGSLTSDEQSRLEGAIARGDLPSNVRTALIDTIAATQLKQLVPALQRLQAPDVADAVWKALSQLGSPLRREDLEAQLASTDARMRTAAMQQLLRQEKTAALARAAQMAKTDPDPNVRVAVVEAIGKNGGRDAVPTLQDIYRDPTWETRQAVGRALLGIGGRDAPEAFESMAFNGPADGQRYAVMLLLISGVQRDDPLVQRVIQSHPDPEIRRLAEHGIEAHEH